MKNMLRAMAAGSLLVGIQAQAAVADTDPSGVWRLQNGKVTVKLSSCGSGYCGTVVGLAKPLDKQGRPKVDRENPDPSLRNRPVIGLTVIQNMLPAGDNQWEGMIYNADDGNTYTSQMSLHGDVMNVKGCFLVLCKTMKFERVN